MAEHSTFPVEVLVPEGEVFNGEVEMLSTRTTTGEIGVLANHAPLLAMLEPTELRLHRGEGVERYAQGEGYLQVYGNRAMVLVEEAISIDRLDTDRLRDELGEARRRAEEAAAGSAEAEVAERDRRRAETFLRIAEHSGG